MNYTAIQNFLSCYSLPTVLIAILISVLCNLLEWILKEKYPTSLKGYAPFILATVFQFIYACIFVFNKITINAEIIYSGLACGSLSVFLSVFIKKIKNGKLNTLQVLTYIITNILKGLIVDSELASFSEKLAKLINLDDNSDDLWEKLREELSNANLIVSSSEELNELVNTILLSAKQLNTKTKIK